MGQRRAHVKTAYHHGNLRADLVTVALDIITRLGPDAATLRAVAKRLGVSQTAPYRHFPSKEALLAAVAADGFDALLRSMQAHLDRAGSDVTARFRSIGTAYVEFALQHRAHFQVMYGIRPAEFALGPVAEAGREAFRLFVSTIEACQSAARAAPGDPSRVAVEAWSFVHGLVTLYLHGLLPRRVDVAELLRTTAQMTIFLSPHGAAPARRPRGSSSKLRRT